MSRIIHRVGGLLAALLMLWLASTGSLVQLLDFKSILSNAPPTDPTQLSIAEGMYGQANFTVIQLRDFGAEAFPKDFDINNAVGTVMHAVPAPETEDGSLLNPVAYVDLRVVNGVPIGQVMMGTKLEAFDAQTGEAVAAVPHEPLPQGRRLPPSLRQKLKTLHRFWNRGDTPGVYFEFLSGLILMTLLITGLVMYFRLLGARARAGRQQIFWLTGSIWRGLHRGVSVVAAAFILCIASTGTWIGFESSVSALKRTGGGAAPATAAAAAPGAARVRNPIDAIIPLRKSVVQDMTATTLAAMQQLHPGTPIKALRLRSFGQMRQGVVITGGATTNQLVFDADTGRPASLTESSYPKVGFPFGVQVHEDIKHFHSGAMFGIPARLMSLLSGLSLIFLAISGLVMYFDMWLRRRKGGRSAFFWK